MKKNINVVLTYGTFDLLHIGHINLLKRIKTENNFVIVGLSTKKFNKLKNKKSFESFFERKKNLLNTKLVDKVVKEKTWNQKEQDIKKYKVKTFYMGSDWTNKFDFLKNEVKVVYLSRTKGISSTELRNGKTK